MAANYKSTKELILDEQKFVTYTSLSKDLCIHVNEAKKLLQQVVQEIKEKQPNVTVNVGYIISGLIDDNSARTIVCSAAELDQIKNTFKTVFFQHIYSVSLSSTAVDTAAIVSVNKLNDFPLCSGLIKGNSCCKRTPDEIGKLKANVVRVESEQKVVPISKKEKIINSMANGSEVKKITKDSETKSVPVIKSEQISPKKNSSNASTKPNTKNGSKSNGIAGFFTKSNSAPSIKTSKPPAPKKVKTEEEEVKKEITTEIDVDMEPEPQPEKPVAIKKEPESASKTKKDTKLSQIKKNAKVDKKRKRVLNVLDSDSDDDPFADEKTDVKENNDSEDEIPPTPATNTVKITSGILNPKKKRKIVDKTYTDEEGYILTRKEEIYESCSDEDVEMKVEPPQSKPEKENVEQLNKIKNDVSPKDKKKSNKKKISPPQKGKQATMMNFFKKI